EFRVGGLVAGLQPLPDDDVARGAGADAAACVVEAGFDALGYIQNAARNAVVSVRDLRRIYFDGLAARKKRYFVFLRGGRVFDFFDVWVAAAHFYSPLLSDASCRCLHLRRQECLCYFRLRLVCGLPVLLILRRS